MSHDAPFISFYLYRLLIFRLSIAALQSIADWLAMPHAALTAEPAVAHAEHEQSFSHRRSINSDALADAAAI